MSIQKYYKLNLTKEEADSLFDAICKAQRANDKKTVYKPEPLRSLAEKWQKYYDSFG